MKKKLLILFSLLAGCFAASAQNNPYEIDDTCYAFFQESEKLVGKPGFQAANELLLQSALAKKDPKAETLYYVERLKNQIRFPSSDDNDRLVDEAQEKLKQVALDKGFMQYYYYSYQLAQNYYYNNQKRYRTVSLMQEMQQTALKHGDAYGIWTSAKYLASLYIEQNDYVSAKKYILQALDLYNTTDDDAVSRQSPTRLYCDLADTYPIGSDSVRICVSKAVQSAKQDLDTLRCTYYQAKLAALDLDQEKYRGYRDFCLNHARFPQIASNGKKFFSLMDAVFDGSIVGRENEIFQLNSVRELKVIANLCENLGLKDFAFSIEKRLVSRLEIIISRSNQSRLSELDVTMGKAALNAELDTKEDEISRISHMLFILLTIIFAGAAAFSVVYIRSLQRGKKKDLQRIEELKEANEKVRLADAAKTRFVQNMSHEVRTPLNAIVGFSQLLSLPDGTLEPNEKEEFSEHIVNNTKMLTMLLDDILNASAMDSGNYRITYEQGEKDFMAQAAISSSEHRLQPGVQLSYVPEEGEPFTFTPDPRRVQQILINLLTNACKHTEKGWIRLSSSLKANPGYVTYAVTDTGPGIPADQAEKIFDRFTKLNEFVQGTGLGLSICRDIAQRMGAKVYLDTTYTEGGSRFIFMVPVAPPQNT